MTQIQSTPEEILELCTKWFNTKKLLDESKALELKLRKDIMGCCFPNSEDKSTQTYTLPDGYVVKGTHKVNVKLDAAALPATLKALPKAIQDRIVQYKPSLVKKEYDNLSEENLLIFSEVLTITPGTPDLKIVKPKVVS